MAKDPAFLFYSSDFLTGTMTMTDEQVGKYIRLLCLQHQKGKLSEKDMFYICKSYDKDIFEKFTKDVEGNYENERLKEETERRKKYSESRSNNRKSNNSKPCKIKKICKSYDKHMENENEIINVDNSTEKGGLGETKNWKTDYEIYHKECHEAFFEFLNNSEKMNKQKELNPGIDVALSIKKGYENFWKTKAGWQHKKKKRTKEIDWEATIINSIDLNKVYLPRNATGNDKTRFDIISERTAKAAELMAESDR